VLDALIGESLKHDLGACHRARHVVPTRLVKESPRASGSAGAVKARGIAEKRE
jgi:hypothetical protein